MDNIDYSHKKLLLEFNNLNIERIYRLFAIKRTLLFSKIAWGIVISFGIIFGFLDKISFGENALNVLKVRGVVIAIAILMLVLSNNSNLKTIFRFNPFIFINTVGLFSIYLTTISSTDFFTPYVLGIAMAFTGVFINTGIGFKHSLAAIINVTIIFISSITLIIDLPSRLLLVYSFFIPSFALIFIYIAFLVEKIFRENFAYSVKLKESLKKVKLLSGFLPICSSCKKIRDDEGYWNQIEKYISEHSSAQFTHSLCPQCSEKLLEESEAQTTLNL